MCPRQITFLNETSSNEQSADGMQRIEPAARLVHGFADVIRRELLLRIFPCSRTDNATAHTGIEPESNHTSIRSLTRVILPPHSGALPMDFIHIRAMQIQFAQIAARLFQKVPRPSQHTRDVCNLHIPKQEAACPNSARGSSDQSMLFASQLPKRPFLICSGTQLMVLFNSTSRSRYALVRMYQESRA